MRYIYAVHHAQPYCNHQIRTIPSKTAAMFTLICAYSRPDYSAAILQLAKCEVQATYDRALRPCCQDFELAGGPEQAIIIHDTLNITLLTSDPEKRLLLRFGDFLQIIMQLFSGHFLLWLNFIQHLDQAGLAAWIIELGENIVISHLLRTDGSFQVLVSSVHVLFEFVSD